MKTTATTTHDFLQLALDFTVQTGKATDPRQELYAFLPDGMGQRLDSIFQRMEYAEEVIEEMKSRYPGREQEVHNTFKHLCPPPFFEEAGKSIYQAYCREIIMLVMSGKVKKKFPMTSAEICLVLKEMSLIAPLTHDAMSLYFKHFIQCFSQAEIAKVFPEGVPDVRETYKGALDELEYTLRRKFDNRYGKGVTDAE